MTFLGTICRRLWLLAILATILFIKIIHLGELVLCRSFGVIALSVESIENVCSRHLEVVLSCFAVPILSGPL